MAADRAEAPSSPADAGGAALRPAGPDAAALTGFRVAVLSGIAARVPHAADDDAARRSSGDGFSPERIGPVLVDGEPLATPAGRGDVAVAGQAGGDPALHYLALAAPYAQPWNVSAAGLDAARAALEAIRAHAEQLGEAGPVDGMPSEAARALRDRFYGVLGTDLDTPAALAVVWRLIRAGLGPEERRMLLLEFDQVLDLGLAPALQTPPQTLPPSALSLIEQRDTARRAKDWARSDELRNQLAALGVEAQDARGASTYRRVR